LTRLIAVLVLGLAACAPSGAAHEETSFSATARALDGDTMAVDFRLFGVDAFERGQLCERAGSCWQCGKAAQDLASRMLRDADAEIQLSTRSSYGRPVATVTVNGHDLGETMIRAGLAIPQLHFLKSNHARAARYSQALTEAQQSKTGAFAGRWIEPAQWRRGGRLSCER